MKTQTAKQGEPSTTVEDSFYANFVDQYGWGNLFDAIADLAEEEWGWKDRARHCLRSVTESMSSRGKRFPGRPLMEEQEEAMENEDVMYHVDSYFFVDLRAMIEIAHNRGHKEVWKFLRQTLRDLKTADRVYDRLNA
jgi:hypothetical protein